MTMNSHGCALPPLGAQVAAFRMVRMSSSDTGSGLYCLTLDSVRIASYRSTSASSQLLGQREVTERVRAVSDDQVPGRNVPPDQWFLAVTRTGKRDPGIDVLSRRIARP